MTHEVIKENLHNLKALEYYCLADEIGEKGTYHTHIFVCFSNPKLYSTMKKRFPHAHFDMIKGNNQDCYNYIRKTGRWTDTAKAETSVEGTFEEWGTLPADGGNAPQKEWEIFEQIQKLIDNGLTPREIMSRGVYMYKYEHIIKKAYFDKRYNETPLIREVTIFYHTGEAGSGKSYEYIKLCKEYGEENVYLMTDYANGGTAGLDGYNGEQVLFMDEFKSNIPYSLLLILTDKFKADIHCRYKNAYALWSELHISSIFPPHELYKGMVDDEQRKRDSIQQFYRRITYIVYHEKVDNKYLSYKMSMKDYVNYEQLKQKAHEEWGICRDGFYPITNEDEVPFDE